MEIFGSALMGYLVGGINPSYIFGKLKGFDIRKNGSGNAGASNAVITMGKTIGVISMAFDIVKAYLVYHLADMLFPGFVLAGVTSGAFCIIGHIFPVFMGFHGGKGLACLAGVAIAFNPKVFLILLAMEAVVALVTNYICMVAITASVIFPAVYGVMMGSPAGALILGLSSCAILFRHVENIRRIRLGIEARISYLWDRKNEIERLKGNYSGEDGEERAYKAGNVGSK